MMVTVQRISSLLMPNKLTRKQKEKEKKEKKSA
jgi:hypothetical protein